MFICFQSSGPLGTFPPPEVPTSDSAAAAAAPSTQAQATSSSPASSLIDESKQQQQSGPSVPDPTQAPASSSVFVAAQVKSDRVKLGLSFKESVNFDPWKVDQLVIANPRLCIQQV